MQWRIWQNGKKIFHIYCLGMKIEDPRELDPYPDGIK
jgi:hypothetical protein